MAAAAVVEHAIDPPSHANPKRPRRNVCAVFLPQDQAEGCLVGWMGGGACGRKTIKFVFVAEGEPEGKLKLGGVLTGMGIGQELYYLVRTSAGA